MNINRMEPGAQYKVSSNIRQLLINRNNIRLRPRGINSTNSVANVSLSQRQKDVYNRKDDIRSTPCAGNNGYMSYGLIAWLVFVDEFVRENAFYDRLDVCEDEKYNSIWSMI